MARHLRILITDPPGYSREFPCWGKSWRDVRKAIRRWEREHPAQRFAYRVQRYRPEGRWFERAYSFKYCRQLDARERECDLFLRRKRAAEALQAQASNPRQEAPHGPQA